MQDARRTDRAPSPLRALLTLAPVLTLGAGLPALALGPGPALLAHAARTAAPTPVTDETVMPLDVRRPVQAVAFRVERPFGLDRAVEVRSENPRIAEALGPARVLAGSGLGYAFVRPVSEGTTAVLIGGRRVLVRVVPGPALSPGDAFAPAPELLSPRAGAAAWGTAHVGVGAWLLPGERPEDLRRTLRLRVGEGPDARLVEPAWVSAGPAESPGPYVLASFPIDFDREPTGPCALTPVRISGSGGADGSGGAEAAGDPVTVQVVRVSEGLVQAGECEADYGLAEPAFVGPPSPPPSSAGEGASGGRFFNNAAREPRFRFPVRVAEADGPGWYQVVLTAGGDASGGALPSVGLYLDEAQRPRTTGAIAQGTWHRTPIGTPVRLEPGFHTLRCDFLNDFAARGTDRNLRLDRIEVARVADARPAAGASADAMTMMAGETMTPAMASAPASAPASASASGTPMQPDAMADGAMDSAANAAIARAGWPANAAASTDRPLRIALERPLDGLPACGTLEIAARTWSAERGAPPPTVALVCDGRVLERQRSDAPRFTLTPDRLAPGGSTVELIAVDAGGLVARTPPQRVFPSPVPGAEAGVPEHPRQSPRLTVHDRAWLLPAGTELKDGKGGDQRLSAPLAQGSTVEVRLSDELEGEFDLFLEARANNGSQPVEVALIHADGPASGPKVAPLQRAVPGYMDAHEVTPPTGAGLTLARGPKRLAITLPAPAGGKPDKSALWAQAVRLVERPAHAAEPAIAVEYPADDGHPVAGADAVVAAVASPERLAWAEVLIDGRPAGLRQDLRRSAGAGRLCVPVLLAGVDPGTHTLALRVADVRGRVATSALRTVNVQSPDSAPGATPYDRAVRLLDRLAFGPEPRELADCLRLGPEAYLRDRLARAAGPQPGDGAADDLGAVRFTNARSAYDVPRRALQRSVATDNPVRARLVLWAQNHFSTWVRKDEAWRKADEDAAFAALGAARFPELLYASSTGPAMLRYLDQERSYGSRLNENYAREIMELHTLGVHGGYTQADVTSLARVLTGWTTVRQAPAAAPRSPDDDGLVDAFRLDPVLADPLKKPADVVGVRFEGAGDAPAGSAGAAGRIGLALEVLCAHPATAEFVCTKLARHYTSVTPPRELVDAMAAAFRRSGGDLREAVLAMAAHPAFWSESAAPRLAHPLDFALRLARTSGHDDAGGLGDFLGASGQGLFDRPTPDGYPEADAEAMDSNALLQRWKVAARAAGAMAAAVPPDVRYSSDPISPALAGTLVDLLSVRLTGRVLSAPSREAALKILAGAAPELPATPQMLVRDRQIQTLAAFIAQLPEANVK